MRYLLNLLLILSLSFSFSACTLISSLLKPDSKRQTQKSTSQPQTLKSEITASEGIELVWKTPTEPVDGFIIHYGYSKDSLNRTARLPINTLTSSQDIEFGSVYRYVIKPIEVGKIVYVSMASFKGTEISEFSEVYEEGPLKR